MDQHPTASPPLPPVPADRAHWSPAKQRLFLKALVQTGCVARAAGIAGMSRTSAHRLRRRLAGTPFDQAWDRALAFYARRMADPFGGDPVPAPPPA
ncbi:LysR family transcriptional regulator [Sphingobium ummariense]